MHLSLPLFNFTQWKDKCTSYSYSTKILTHSMCQVSLVVKYIWAATWDFQQCGMCDQQPAHTRSLIRAFACRLNIKWVSIKLLSEHNLEFLSLKARLSLFMSKCHIVANHMSRFICHSKRSNKDELYIFKIFLKVVHRISGNRKR